MLTPRLSTAAAQGEELQEKLLSGRGLGLLNRARKQQGQEGPSCQRSGWLFRLAEGRIHEEEGVRSVGKEASQSPPQKGAVRAGSD